MFTVKTVYHDYRTETTECYHASENGQIMQNVYSFRSSRVQAYCDARNAGSDHESAMQTAIATR